MRSLQVALAGLMPGVLGNPAQAQTRDIGRDTLPANDGWAAYGPGTTGGAADAEHVFTVTDRAGLVRALDGPIDSAAAAGRAVARGAGAGRIR
ncbi:hypothetical protein [Streptomyces sp. WAC04114]|uniref:hypothetical protein n=1 Tax=Streptomyces sp. WAC04114 TaxID=2867961 RepID=UPI0035AC2590